MKNRKFPSLHKWLYTPKVIALLDPWQCGWGDGGCAMLAEALRRCAARFDVPASLLAFVRASDGQLLHVLCRTYEVLVDFDGYDSVHRKLRQWRELEAVRYEVAVRAVSQEELKQDADIPFDEATIEALADLLRRNYTKIEDLSYLWGLT